MLKSLLGRSQREKHELRYLNDRFASYIERVRFLEAKNKKLQLDIDQLRERRTSQSSKIKEMYEIEMREAQFIIDDTDKDRVTADLRIKQIEEKTLKLQDRYSSLTVERDSDRQEIDSLQKQISDNEADVNLYHRRLIDLEDEHQRYHSQSQGLILDIQHLTKELDRETLTRKHLENEKQKVEEEIHFLQDIHSQNLEEIKQTNLSTTQLDPTDLFQHELSNTVRNIRDDYEQRDYHQRNEFQSQYRWNAFKAMQQLQSHRVIEQPDKIHEQEELKKLQTLIVDSRQDIATQHERNEQLENRIRELEKLIHTERDDHNRVSDEYDRQVNELRTRLEGLDRDYEKLNSTKSSLDSEITGYRKLLEGDEKSEGLRQTITYIKEQALGYLHGNSPTSVAYLGSYQGASTSQGNNNDRSTVTAYAPFSSISSTTTEPTVFEQTYDGYRPQRPTTITSTFQWIPLVNHLSNYQWNGNHINGRRMKTMTLFGTGTMRDQQLRKAVTPPSSDYTDAYLSAFAPKRIPTKHIYRFTTPLFSNALPARTHLSTDNSFKTSQTHFNNINNAQTLSKLNRIVPSFYSSTSTRSSNFTPDIFTKYVPFSTTQPSISETQPSSSTYPSDDHFESSFENIHKPVSPSSIRPSTTMSSALSTPKPSVSFQSAPLSSLDVTDDDDSISKTKDQSYPNIEKPMERPDSLLFQPDEDMHSSYIEKSPSFFSPLLESPANPKLEPEHRSIDELSIISSRPIEILENTVTKYDSLINQISDILAGVSPLNATASGISPNKSILDYEVSSNGSPILQRRHIQPQSPEETTSPVRNICIQLVKTKDLIRDDSYDKITTAIADLDSEMTPPIENRMPSLLEQEHEETNNFSFDQDRTSSLLNEEKEEREISLHNEQQLSSIVSRDQNEDRMSVSDILTDDKSSPTETKLNEENLVDKQSQTGILSNMGNAEAITQETSVSVDEVIPNKNDEKHVRWSETIINNDDDETSSCQSRAEESNSSELPMKIMKEDHLTSVVKQNTVSDEKIVHDEEMNKSTLIESSNSDEQQFISNTPTTLSIGSSENEENREAISKLRRNIIKRQIKFSTSLETSSSFSDSIEPQSTSSDLNESRGSHDEQIISSSNSPVDPPSKDALTVDTQSSTCTPGDVTTAELDNVESTTHCIGDTENDQSNEQIQSSSSDIILQKIPDELTTITESMQDLTSADFDNGTVTLDSSTDIVEPVQNQGADTVQSQSSEVPILLSSDKQWSEHQGTQQDEQILTEPIVSSVDMDTIDKESIPADIIEAHLGNHEEQDMPVEIESPIISSISLSKESDDEAMPDLPTTSESNELSPVDQKDHEIILHTVQVLIDDIIQTALSSSYSNTIPTSDKRLPPDDIKERSTDEFEFDSISLKSETKTNSSKPSIEFHESSPTNTEPNSFELIHALRGHSIALPTSPKHILHPPERSSSSTTTSSQITTSSDRYISYAIHEMHDSSQDRLPALPIAADIPIYKNIDEHIVLPTVNTDIHSISKDDDSTECDASDNLTSYSDDVLLRKLYRSVVDRKHDLDASSTDDDVDEEFEVNDTIDPLTQPNSNLNMHEKGYQLYDLATTPSSNDSSTSPSKQQADDIYIIPGYSGLWRPSADNERSKSPIDYDINAERKTVIEMRTIVPQMNSVRRPLTFQHSRNPTKNIPQTEILTSGVPTRPDTIDIFNRPLNEFSFDMSESDSYYQTCPSSVQRQEKQAESCELTKSDDYTESSPDESIILIRERERGVSLPVTMNIDYDEMAFRLSTSTPSEAHLWSTGQPHISLTSLFAHSQPALLVRTNPSSQASSPSCSTSEHDQQKLSSWLNTVNTVTTTTEGSNGPLESHITFMKSSKGPISISECHPEGHYVIIDNTSRSKNIDLTNWIIRQENDNEDRIIFRFPEHCLLKANHSLKILSKTNESEQRNDDLIATSVSSWLIHTNIVTTLNNPDGKVCASLAKKTTTCS